MNLFQTKHETDLTNPLLLINNNAKNGDLCLCEDTGHTMIRENNAWTLYHPKVEGESFQMSLYELNKTAVSQMPNYNQDKLDDLCAEINQFEHGNGGFYYMLLNNENHYYTLLHLDKIADFNNIGEAVIELLSGLGPIVAHEVFEDHVEIWIKIGKEAFVYLLFNYDRGVVTYA